MSLTFLNINKFVPWTMFNQKRSDCKEMLYNLDEKVNNQKTQVETY